MDLEIELWQKAAEWVHKQYGWCESMRECQKEKWGYLLKGCNSDSCDDYDKCNLHRYVYSFVSGCGWMIHRVKPIVLDKVIKDLVLDESPYQDGPAFFEEKI